MVPGGLGERLGYPGIKVELPTEMTTEICFLELYARYILAIQDYANSRVYTRVCEFRYSDMFNCHESLD